MRGLAARFVSHLWRDAGESGGVFGGEAPAVIQTSRSRDFILCNREARDEKNKNRERGEVNYVSTFHANRKT